MDIILAGYNVDTTILENLKKSSWDGKNNITPETISAAYARISRDPRPITELRNDAREEVDKARKSNENIVFKMGHHSIAEHAYLNFDILGISRYASEFLEESRLCSYTEKSQRYITLKGEYVIPDEFKNKNREIFENTVKKQIDAYFKLYNILLDYQKEKNPDLEKTKQGQNLIDGLAKEDARYVLPLATECQIGFSCNARNLEYIIRKTKYNKLSEVQELSKKLFDTAKTIVPSLIILSDPENFKKQFGIEVSDGILKSGKSNIKNFFNNNYQKYFSLINKAINKKNFVKLINHTNNPDKIVLSSLIFNISNYSFEDCLKIINNNPELQNEIIKEAFKDLSEHDSLYREFETVNFIFEIILSASAFAQLKRHRMMTIIKQPYDIDLGYTIPHSIKETNSENILNEIMELTHDTYKILSKENQEAANYILTNANRRKVLINVNLRELHHISRLRMDSHAQWDIREITTEMVEQVKKVAPLTGALLCGKDSFKIEKEDFINNN